MRLPTFISGLCLSLLVTISQMSSYKILPTKRYNSLLKARDDYDESNDVIGTQDYFPTSGIETFVSTIASRRPLLPSEYECSFLSFPVLQERYLNKKFPERELEESEDVARLIVLSWACFYTAVEIYLDVLVYALIFPYSYLDYQSSRTPHMSINNRECEMLFRMNWLHHQSLSGSFPAGSVRNGLTHCGYQMWETFATDAMDACCCLIHDYLILMDGFH